MSRRHPPYVDVIMDPNTITAAPADTPIEAPEAMLPDELYFARKCHLCGKIKHGSDEWRVDYEMAFHYDRRHRGWTA